MTNLFIFTASDEAAQRNFVHTIESGVPFDDLAHVLPETTATQLADSTGSDLVFAWGAQEKNTGNRNVNRHTWQQMQAGDVVLGYRSKSIVAVASVVAAIDNIPVAETLWGTYPDGAFHLMYFLTRPVILDPAVPWEAVQDVLGGSPLGFRKTADQRISRIVNDFGTVESFVQDRITDNFMGGTGSPEVAEAEVLIDEIAGKSRRGQGFGGSAPFRKAVEEHAMSLALSHYCEAGWDSVRDVSSKKSYDILCTSGTAKLRVEVKGTISEGTQVLLTKNEVAHAKERHPHVALFVVSGITVEDRASDNPMASGGSIRILEPWTIGEGTLLPFAFSYVLPNE